MHWRISHKMNRFPHSKTNSWPPISRPYTRAPSSSTSLPPVSWPTLPTDKTPFFPGFLAFSPFSFSYLYWFGFWFWRRELKLVFYPFVLRHCWRVRVFGNEKEWILIFIFDFFFFGLWVFSMIWFTRFWAVFLERRGFSVCLYMF